ncbi:MAG: SpoIIE family protein phosphatase, partial [Akkermansiaceae bacterium]|nr:SpoIIE family protein phosphatase [Armatimonadota bacterium]
VRAKQPLQEFGVALVSVVVAMLFRLPFTPLLGAQVPFITFFPAIVVGAWLGGWRGGLTATTLSVLVAVYFLIPPHDSLLITTTADQLSVGIFLFVGVCASAMGSLQRNREHELARSESRFRLLLETANEGVVRTDTDDRITFINERMAQMIGFAPDQLLGQPIDSLFCPEDVERVPILRSLGRKGTVDQLEFRLRHRDGSDVWALVSVTAVHDAGEFAETFGLFTDITERKKAAERVDAAYRRETQINQIGQAIRGTNDPGEIRSVASRTLGAALCADRAYYSAFDLAHDQSWIEEDYRRSDLPSLTGKYTISSFDVTPADYYPAGETLVMQDTHDGAWSTAMSGALKSSRVRSLISVPLYDGGTLVGTLAVAMADEARDWTPGEITLVETIAVQTRSALDISRVHYREHRIAAELQNALLPSTPPRIPRLELAPYMKPALDEAEIGGDFYDVFALDERHHCLIIGDVSGKGLAAAAQLALIRNSLRTTLYLYHPPGHAVTQLNHILTQHDLLVGFVTAFVAVYDSASGQITYASCGHEPGMIRRAATGDVEELEATGPPLGASENAIFTEATTRLTTGDVLFLYTDGLSEAGPNRRQLLGTDGLRAMFASQGEETEVEAMASRIVADTSAYAEGTFRDDVCLLIARYLPAEVGEEHIGEG